MAARRRGSPRSRPARSALEMVSRRQAHRLRLVGLARSRDRRAQAKRRKERKDSKVKAHVTERAESRYWDHWLTDGREPHVFVCDVATGGAAAICSPAPASRCRRGSRRPSDYDVAPDGRELALTVDLAAEPGMMNSARHRRRQARDAAQARSDRRHRIPTMRHPRYSPDGRIARVPFVRHQALVQRPGPPDAAERARPGACGALAPKLDRRPTHVAWTPDGRALLVHARGPRPRSALWRLALDADAMPARVASPAERVGGFAQSRDGSVHRVRPLGEPVIRRRCSRAAPTAAASARSNRSTARCSRAHAFGEMREVTVKGWGGDAGADVGRPIRRTSTRRRSGRCCIRSTAGRTPRTWTAGISAGTRRSSPGRAMSSSCVNYHGSSGFGQKWLETITRRYGEKEFADVEAGTDWHAAAGLHRPHSGWSPPAAATAATWSRT